MRYRSLRILTSILLLVGLTFTTAPAAFADKSQAAANSSWSDWEDLGGVLVAGPAVSSWANNRLDVFGTGTDNHMYHKWWNGSSWSNWEDLGGVIIGNPAAVSWGRNRIDTFARGTDNHLYHKWWS